MTTDRPSLYSSSCILFLPSLKNRCYFLRFSSFISLSNYTSIPCLWIPTGRIFLAFKKQLNTDSTSHVAKFSIIVFIFNDYSEWVKNYDTVLGNTRAPLPPWPSQEVRASPARPLFAIGSYFLGASRNRGQKKRIIKTIFLSQNILQQFYTLVFFK